MNNNVNYISENFTNSLTTNNNNNNLLRNDIQPRRNSYQIAILTSKQDRLEVLCSNASSISSIIDHINTTRSLCAISDSYSCRVNGYIQRSTSQPVVRSAGNNSLLENATLLLDSPVHGLHKSLKVSPLTKSFSSSNPPLANQSSNERTDSLSSSAITIISGHRILLLRSFASVLVLACLFSTEVLQTSIYSMERSFQILLTLHLSSSISALSLAAYTSHTHANRCRWKISDMLAYDRCSQILIVFTTIFTSTWIIMQYFHSFYYCLLVSACVTGVCLSCMIIKTFDHLLQLSTTLPIEDRKFLTERIKLFICIYNCICHLALAIGGGCFLVVILFQQWKYNYILIGSQSCIAISCLQLINQQDDSKQFLEPTAQAILINLNLHLGEKTQVWANEPTRYILFISLIVLMTISLIIQISTEWTTSVITMSRRLSIFTYSNKDAANDISNRIHSKYYLFALFIGFQEGYVFGNIIKFDVTCLYGLRHAAEMLIIYGLSSTISSVLIVLIIKRMTTMTCITFTTLLHSITIIISYFTRMQDSLYNIDSLTMKYVLFFSYGIVLGLWSTILIYSICNSMKVFSSSTFAQSLALRYLGRIIAYSCAVLLCQSFLFYVDTLCLLCMFGFIFISYCCCRQ
ncbi:unnamed protein product [Rotaria socialis]|uniref:Uncharacterized protein n=1 Tax=Rotaria socialis TaxID=392032 RepID=A0A820Z4Z3_9BILA|nr:unnamed protein product [Rotaria socialis]CAF4559330.1 unnamed protein product [Rotaria socialis]